MCLLCVAAAAAVDPAGATAVSFDERQHHDNFYVANFVSPVLFQVLGFKVYSYGTLVAAALGSAFLVFGQELRRARIKIDEYTCFFVFLIGFGIGSKAHLALSAIGAGEELSWKSFDIRSGHSFMGSQLGAVSGMILLIRYHSVSILEFLDVLLPCCLLGHAVGKVGCFLSGDGCYGPPADPADVPWAMSFPNASVPTVIPVHPTPLYETLCSLMVFLVVRGVLPLPPVAAAAEEDQQEAVETSEQAAEFASKRPAVGRRTSLLLVLYGIERVLIEPFRRHPPMESFAGLTEYQVLAIILLFIGMILEAYGKWSRHKLEPSRPERPKSKKA